MKLNNPAKIANYIPRTVEKTLETFVKSKEVTAVIGPRQTGKTTLIMRYANKLTEQKKKVAYVTFEDKKALNLFQSNIDDFIELYKNHDLVILDEFHYAQEGGQKLKYIYDTTNLKLIISGSSSLELTFQTGKYMVGRMLTIHVWPLSFREYLSYCESTLYDFVRKHIPPFLDIPQENNTISHKSINALLDKHFINYLLFGGYPRVIVEDNREFKKTILENLVNTYLLKDIKDLLSLATDKELYAVTRLLATQIGNIINYNELSNATAQSVYNVKKHIHILEQTYILARLKPFFTNKRQEILKTPKVYFIDTGLRNVLIENFNAIPLRQDTGALVENFVYTRLLEEKSTFSTLHFWRTKSQAEVDFILQNGEETIPIEVKYSVNPTAGKSLYSFIKKFSPRRAFVLTRGFTDIQKINQTRVLFMPVYYL